MSRDTFTRSTSFGLGTGWTWDSRDTSYGAAADSLWFVDGSKVVIPDNGADADSYTYSVSPPTAGTIAFDIFLPVLGVYDGSTEYWPFIKVEAGFDATFITPATLYLEEDYANPTGGVRIGKSFSSSTAVAATPGEWHTAKMAYDMPGNFVRYKFWRRDQPEPAWQYTTTPSSGSFDDDIWIDFLNAGTSISYLDNFVVEGSVSVSWFNLDALIQSAGGSVTYDGSFTANAVKKAARANSFTANAWLEAGGDRDRHYRDRDHTGNPFDTQVKLARAIGPYPAGTFVSAFLADMSVRIGHRSSTRITTLTADAVVKTSRRSAFVVGARIFKTGTQPTATITIKAVKAKSQSSSFTINAVIP